MVLVVVVIDRSIDLSICLSASLKTKLEFDNVKNETILRDFLQKWKVECRADGLVPMGLAIFPLRLSKVLRLPRKSDARSYEVLRLSRKIMFPKLKILCSKMQSPASSLLGSCTDSTQFGFPRRNAFLVLWRKAFRITLQ